MAPSHPGIDCRLIACTSSNEQGLSHVSGKLLPGRTTPGASPNMQGTSK